MENNACADTTADASCTVHDINLLSSLLCLCFRELKPNKLPQSLNAGLRTRLKLWHGTAKWISVTKPLATKAKIT